MKIKKMTPADHMSIEGLYPAAYRDTPRARRTLAFAAFPNRGIPASVITFAVVVTVGYGLLLVAGF